MDNINAVESMNVSPLQTSVITSAQVLQLQTWFSPAFPTGAFAYSHGIESAIADDWVTEATSLLEWLTSIIEHGSGWNDAVLMSAAWRTASEHDWPALQSIDSLALALPAGAERDHETRSMGVSFAKAASVWINESVAQSSSPEARDAELPPLWQLQALPVVSGAAAAAVGLPVDPFITAAAQSSSSNLVWIAARLIPLGQSDALGVIAALSSTIQRTAKRAAHSTLDELGSCATMADIASMKHEHLQTRICRT